MTKVSSARWVSYAGLAVVGLLVLVLAIQGVRSAYRTYPSALPGYQVQPFDATPRWYGTRGLFRDGINPYSPEGDALIQSAYFGRALEAADSSLVVDRQRFAYPL